MQITLTEREIHAALRKYIVARLRLSDSEEIKVDLMATRGVDGFKAVLDIIEPDDALEFVPTAVSAPVPTLAIKHVPETTARLSAEPVKETATVADAVVAVTEQLETVVKAALPAFNIPNATAPKPAPAVDDIPPFDVTPAAPAKVSGLFAHLANS
jgi:hypothetical protein